MLFPLQVCVWSSKAERIAELLKDKEMRLHLERTSSQESSPLVTHSSPLYRVAWNFHSAWFSINLGILQAIKSITIENKANKDFLELLYNSEIVF